MTILTSASNRLSRYLAHPDPRVAISNKVAAIVVSNQPFYPLYLWLILGRSGLIGCMTWLTTPGFALVPFVARRNATAGRLLMTSVGLANTLLCVELLGTGSGVGWFAVPCAAVAIASVHGVVEWRLALGLVALCLVAGLVPLAWPPAWDRGPVLTLAPPELASLTRLHLVSVGSLLVVIGYLRVRTR